MVSAVFERSGELFVPTAAATGPWAADKLHGGPILGVLAREVERVASDPQLLCARLTVDMFRPAPHAPLAVRSEVVRQGGRLLVMQAGLFAGELEVARATALLLRESDLPGTRHAAPARGYEGLPTESLMRGMRDPRVPLGFHTCVETRWPPRAAGDPLAIWFHWPLALVDSELPSPFQQAAALSDFANAVASIADNQRENPAVPYINSDATLYFSRRPEGEWFCLQELGSDVERGISVAEVVIADSRGVFGRVVQARLALTR
ncbi:MAG TPA: acyl-CoA thioesterase domain-containing protein [Polyangiales bacterium]|nr:acyl-CoA thioesterase domain-containing protein [Polyangiales bacterium]